jgi:probable addiction module antidote protein
VTDVADTLTESERADLLESIRIVLDARQGAKQLPELLRYEVCGLRDMAWLARTTGMNRTALFRTLSGKGNPKLDTLDAILPALGLRLSVEAVRRP